MNLPQTSLHSHYFMTNTYRKCGPKLACLVLLLFIASTAMIRSTPLQPDRNSPISPESNLIQAESGGEIFLQREQILIGIHHDNADPPLLEAIAKRIDSLDSVSSCWTPQRLMYAMESNGVSKQEAEQRLTRFLLNPQTQVTGLVAVLSAEGEWNRTQVVREIREILEYSQLSSKQTMLAGSPVVAAALSQLGDARQLRTPLTFALLLILGGLIRISRSWRIAVAILVSALFSMQLTQLCLLWGTGAPQLIRSFATAMVLMLTCVHAIFVLHCVQTSRTTDPFEDLWVRVGRPCLWTTVALVGGCCSLSWASTPFLQQLSVPLSIGVTVAFVCGFGLTPFALALFPSSLQRPRTRVGLSWSHRLFTTPRLISLTAGLIAVVALFGLSQLTFHHHPLKLLSNSHPAVQDHQQTRRQLADVETLDAVIDFGTADVSLAERFKRVQMVESRLAQHPQVTHVFSWADFVPDQLDATSIEAFEDRIPQEVESLRNQFVSAGDRYWRVTTRTRGASSTERQRTLSELKEQLSDVPIIWATADLQHYTSADILAACARSLGIVVLLTCVLVLIESRSWRLAGLSLFANIAPWCVVFGSLGWLNRPVDVGTLVCPSIALALTTTVTFQYLACYQQFRQRQWQPHRSAWAAQVVSAAPIVQSVTVTLVLMLAMASSSLNTLFPVSTISWAVFVPSVAVSGLLISGLCGTANSSRTVAPTKQTTYPAAEEPRIAA